MLLVDELQRAGGELVFLNRALGQTPEAELLLQVQAMVAEYERAKILERSRRGKRHAAQRGDVSVLSGAPYGYRYVRKADGGGQARDEIVLEEARLVRQVFTWMGQERLSSSPSPVRPALPAARPQDTVGWRGPGLRALSPDDGLAPPTERA